MKNATAARLPQGEPLGSLDLQTAASLDDFYEDLRRRLVALYESPTYQPPLLPATALQVLELARNHSASVEQMVEALEQDPVLAGAVLRLAQSAGIGGGTNIRSLHAAVSRMGMVRAAALFYRVSVEAKIFRVPGYAEVLERLRQHSVMTAEIARFICGDRGMDDGLGYLAGLLHDVGIAGALVAIADAAKGRVPTPFSHVWPAISGVHGHFTHRLLRLWMVPTSVTSALACHHQVTCDEADDALAMVTVMAEVLAAAVGMGFEKEEQSSRLAHAAQRLGYAVTDLERLERVAQNLRSELAAPLA